MSHNEPLTEEEINELLGMTLNGALPAETMNRVFSTLAVHRELLRRVATLEDCLPANQKPDDETHIECGRQACTNVAHPAGWNCVTGLMYCLQCMHTISQYGEEELFPLKNADLTGGAKLHTINVSIRRHQVTVK